MLTVRTMGMVFNAVPEFAYLNLVRSIIIYNNNNKNKKLCTVPYYVPLIFFIYLIKNKNKNI